MSRIEETTIEEIMNEYADLIEEIKVSEYFSQDKAIARLIAIAIYLGVDRSRTDLIAGLIERVFSERYQAGRTINWKESNYSIMKRIIEDEPYLVEDHSFGENDLGSTEYTGEYLEEYEDIYKSHNR